MRGDAGVFLDQSREHPLNYYDYSFEAMTHRITQDKEGFWFISRSAFGPIRHGPFKTKDEARKQSIIYHQS